MKYGMSVMVITKFYYYHFITFPGFFNLFLLKKAKYDKIDLIKIKELL